MKQHITIEQLNDLSPKAYEKLVLWVTGISIPEYSSFEGIMISNPGLREKAILSIGQMIQFIAEKGEIGKLGIVFDNNNVFVDGLCDALWEETRNILSD